MTLSNGDTTDNVILYSDAWKAVYEPVAEVLELSCIGFDENHISFGNGQAFVQLESWVVVKIARALNMKKDEK